MPQGSLTLPFNTGASVGTGGTVSSRILIDSAHSGIHYTLNAATSSVAVFRNGIEEPDYSFTNHTWTFTNALSEGEKLTFVYNI